MGKFVLIAAYSSNGGIGYKGKLPWKCREDLKEFKRKTTGNVVVMGRKTFESIGSKPLPDRMNVVISHVESTIHAEGVKYSTLNIGLLNWLKELPETIYIIGGEEIYKQFFDYADEIDLTEIQGEYRYDTYFPNFAKLMYNPESLGFNRPKFTNITPHVMNLVYTTKQ